MFDSPNSIKKHKRVVIDFTASWCAPCKRIAPHYSKLEEKYKNVVFFKIDVDKYEEMAKEFNIESMPTFVSLLDGKVFDTFTGANEQKLEQLIRDVSEQ